jgi:Tar ligand binding domain homologue
MNNSSSPRRLTVAAQLALGFGLLIVLLCIAGAVALNAMFTASRSLQSMYDDRAMPLKQLSQMQYAATRDRVILVDALMQENPDVTKRRLAEFEKNRQKSDKAWAEFMATQMTTEERALAEKVQSSLATLVNEGFRPMAQALGSGQQEAARAALDKKISPLNPAFVKAIDDLQTLQLAEARL